MYFVYESVLLSPHVPAADDEHHPQASANQRSAFTAPAERIGTGVAAARNSTQVVCQAGEEEWLR